MSAKKARRLKSAFDLHGLKQAIDLAVEEAAQLYRADNIPWVVGYSGGKDSTAVLQLIWLALESLEPQERIKPVYVITTDTQVENPIVATWVARSLEHLGAAAAQMNVPIEAHQLKPELNDRYWVNLLGRGYPAPRPKFRWCTERLKIKPSNRFISDVVRENGEAILVLGTRKAESSKRAHVMDRLERRRTRENLSPNANLPNSLVYTPIEAWSNDDVWLFLMQVPNKWGITHKDLLTMYQGASAGGECPLVVDKSTPSCGDSRFGCWVCTVVDRDRSMQAMIQNDEEKEWMLPLLELRDELGERNDRRNRDFRRLNGSVQLFHDRTIPGPYKQSFREDLLRRVLETERWVRENGPDYVRDLRLVPLEELREIRRIWVVEKHELEDSLPGIYEEVWGEPFPQRLDDSRVFGADEIRLLRQTCGDDDLLFSMLRELLDIEWRTRHSRRRSGLYERLEEAITRHFYSDEEDATERERQRKRVSDAAKKLKNKGGEIVDVDDQLAVFLDVRRKLEAGRYGTGAGK